MSDVFISYANEDQDKVAPIVNALENRGWSIWWDRTILPGKQFDLVIEEAIEAAKCVIVIWSNNSVDSLWVRAEAAEGWQRGIVVPVLIDYVKPPLAFRQIQAAKLIDWQGDVNNPEFESLIKAITAILDSTKRKKTEKLTEEDQGLGKAQKAKRRVTLPDQNVIRLEQQNGITVFYIEGDVTALSESSFNEAYRQANDHAANKILLKFSEDAYINSGGIAVLIQILSKTFKNKQIVGITGLTDHFKKIFNMVGITKFATIYNTLDDALKYM